MAGDHLVHGDLRGDNTVLVDRAAVAVDWPCAARCAAFWDAVGMLPPGIPHLRAFQRAQAEVGVAWLRRRLGE